jgi:hypothetical protein
MVADVAVGPNARVSPAAIAFSAVTPPAVTSAADAEATAMRLVRLSLKFMRNIPFFDDPVLR